MTDMMYVTSLDHPEYSDTYNKYDGYHNPVVLHKDWNHHLGRFPSMTKLQEFLDFAGLKLGEKTEERHSGKAGMFRMWNVEPAEVDDRGFTKLIHLPEDVKPFTGLSNGSLVTCYLYNDGKVLHIYRPNPNYEAIYKPLSTEEHIRFCRENGYV